MYRLCKFIIPSHVNPDSSVHKTWFRNSGGSPVIRRHTEACVRARGEHFENLSSQHLDLVGSRTDGDPGQLTQHKQLTTELSNKIVVESGEDRYMLRSLNSEMGTIIHKSRLY